MGHKSPSSKRYLANMDTAEILATRRAIRAVHDGTQSHWPKGQPRIGDYEKLGLVIARSQTFNLNGALRRMSRELGP